MSEGISYKQILNEDDRFHSLPKKKNPKYKALKKAKESKLTGRSQKEQMRFTRQNRYYQKKIGRAWND